MTFVNKQLDLPGSRMAGSMPMRECSKCLSSRVPEGGVELRPGKWVCASCWTRRLSGLVNSGRL